MREVVDALKPRSLRERLHLRLVGGWTAAQVYERLSPELRTALAGPFEADAATRRVLDQVYRMLVEASARGEVRRKQVRYTMSLNTKGPRDMLVDVFR